MVNPILQDEEDGIYFEYLALLELLMHTFHSKYHINGRQAQEILQLVLFDIKSIVEQENYDCSNGRKTATENVPILSKNPFFQKKIRISRNIYPNMWSKMMIFLNLREKTL